jgi:hypothetical protein
MIIAPDRRLRQKEARDSLAGTEPILQIEGMLTYVKTKGWLDDRGWIQAHCEQRP